jgi:hypothetical protein
VLKVRQKKVPNFESKRNGNLLAWMGEWQKQGQLRYRFLWGTLQRR